MYENNSFLTHFGKDLLDHALHSVHLLLHLPHVGHLLFQDGHLVFQNADFNRGRRRRWGWSLFFFFLVFGLWLWLWFGLSFETFHPLSAAPVFENTHMSSDRVQRVLTLFASFETRRNLWEVVLVVPTPMDGLVTVPVETVFVRNTHFITELTVGLSTSVVRQNRSWWTGSRVDSDFINFSMNLVSSNFLSTKLVACNAPSRVDTQGIRLHGAAHEVLNDLPARQRTTSTPTRSLSRESCVVEQRMLTPVVVGESSMDCSFAGANTEHFPWHGSQAQFTLSAPTLHLRPHVPVFHIDAMSPGLLRPFDAFRTCCVHEVVVRQQLGDCKAGHRPIWVKPPLTADESLHLGRVQPAGCHSTGSFWRRETDICMELSFRGHTREVSVELPGLQLSAPGEEGSNFLELHFGWSSLVCLEHQCVDHFVSQKGNFRRCCWKFSSHLVVRIPSSDRFQSVSLHISPNCRLSPQVMQSLAIRFERRPLFHIYESI